jgi:hypothetical protein
MIDPIQLAAEARPLLEKLHKRNDIVVRFKSDKSGYKEDATDALDAEAPGHFRSDRRVLTLNLDTLVKDGTTVTSLKTIEDFRKHPVLAGVAAHEAAHARFSLWGTVSGDEFPESIPNPDYMPLHEHDDECGDPCTEDVEGFPVSETGQLAEIATMLEEPRVERLGSGIFTKTWKRGMQLAAAHFIIEGIEEAEGLDKDPLDSALALAISVGGRLSAGTLGVTHESRKAVNRILTNVQKVIETSLPDADDPYHEIMGLINKHVYSNEHVASIPHLESARKILKVLHPEQSNDPDEANDPEGEEGEEGGEEGSEGMSAAAAEMQAAMNEAVDAFAETMKEEVRIETDRPESLGDNIGGNGAVVYNDRRAPKVSRHEQPNDDDRALYRRANDWMERQIQPTVTQTLRGQWLPGGGARLNVRNYIKDNLAGNLGAKRSDWDKVSETIKHAPPVKVAIMLDGSGSMGNMARPSAAIAWAAANAAANLPESRTVSVVFGDGAAVTQKPGHFPAKTIAVSNTDGGWENWKEASKLVKEALWLDDPIEEGQESNVLIIVVSDLQYNREGQGEAFVSDVKEWADKGYTTLVVGANVGRTMRWNGQKPEDMENITLVTPRELFA